MLDAEMKTEIEEPVANMAAGPRRTLNHLASVAQNELDEMQVMGATENNNQINTRMVIVYPIIESYNKATFLYANPTC